MTPRYPLTLMLSIVLLLSCNAMAASRADDVKIKKLYANVPASHSKQIAKRIAADSAYFVGKPYLLGPLGEGLLGEFDQNPLYRADKFDCVTYTSTIIALAHANNLAQFKKKILQLRYRDGVARYSHRNHFMTVDWNLNNSHKGYVKDITYRFIDKQGKPIAKIANAIINKPAWYQHKKTADIKFQQTLSPTQLQQKLSALKHIGSQLLQQRGVLLYLPLTKLFNAKGKPNTFIFQQIPSASVIEIVRPNWHLEKLIGTAMNVSHLGFAIRTAKGLMYREASQTQKHVIDIPLTKYLRGYLKSPTVKGINVQLIT